MELIAHRGFAHCAPENTLAAFDFALKNKAKGLELDVHLTKDKEIVVIHDLSLDRTTDLRGHISDLTLSQIRKADAGSHFDARFKTERVPTLKELIELVHGKATLYIELKKGRYLYEGLEKRVLDILNRTNARKYSVLHSFQSSIVKKIASLDDEIPLLLTRDRYFTLLNNPSMFFSSPVMSLKNMKGLNLNAAYLTSTLVKQIHAREMKLLAWTVNSMKDYRKLQSLKVDGVISNELLGRNPFI